MSRPVFALLASVLAALGGFVAYRQVAAEPAPIALSTEVQPTDPPRPPPQPVITTTTTTTTTTTAPPPPPAASTRAPRRSAPAPAPAPAPPPPPAPAPAPTTVNPEGAEGSVLANINSERAKRGFGALSMNGAARGVARNWSSWMANNNRLAHNSNHPTQLRNAGVNWRVVGENVGMGQSTGQVHGLFMSSGGHRNNILNPEYSQVGIGVVQKGENLYITVDFVGY